MSPPAPAPARPPTSGLFRRIYLTFVGTVVVFAALSGLLFFSIANHFGPEWVAELDDAFEGARERLVADLDDPEALAEELTALSRELDLRLVLRTLDGRVLAGDPNLPPPPPRHRRIARLRNGQPMVIRRQRLNPPLIHWGLMDPRSGEVIAVLTGDPSEPGRMRWLFVGAGLGLLVILALGALPLARSLVRRLAQVESGAERIAGGDLGHRLPLPAGGPADEVDALAATFNRMAERLQGLVGGQRILLANVSHELRTPVARMRVLVEILEERAERLRAQIGDGDPTTVDRLGRGLRDLTDDLREIEGLIADLLTSGKLELAEGGGVERAPIDVAEFLGRLGDRFAADVRVDPPGLELDGDPMLLGRLLSNLLANGRRACPDGAIELQARAEGAEVVLVVQDEGPGIEPANREVVFEPFSRLDGARDRDRGGVGLGLYLCRQIARAHGGTIRVEDRPDGRRGARFVIRLPQRRTA
ncbi:MAG: HAMP domain-containing protein [Myxococcales bacterium]|nr:HAMP domain-containing protein [Myxococcales bacterium]